MIDLTQRRAPPPAPLAPPPPPLIAAVKRNERNAWPGLRALVAGCGVKSITAIDPGTRNLAIMRMAFDDRSRITHAKVIDLDDLCFDYTRANATFHLSTASAPTLEMQLYALTQYVAAETKPGGAFESDMLIVEDQSFDRVMARVEAAITCAFNLNRPHVRVNGASAIAAGQIIAAQCVKAAYRPLFPLLEGERDDVNGSDNKRARAFGVGNVRDQRSAAQRAENKRNARKFGSMIMSRERLLASVERLDPRDRARLSRGDLHDIMDVLFMCFYFVSSWMFSLYKFRRDKPADAVYEAFENPSQRKRQSEYQEVVDLCAELGTPAANIEILVDILCKRLDNDFALDEP